MSRNDDPRARRSRAAVLAAGVELLVEGGPEQVTHGAVAKRAAVGRATVYRHWPDSQALLRDVLAAGAHPLLTPGEGPVREQMTTQLGQQADWLNQPVSASVIATVIERAERDEAVRHLRAEMFERTGEQSVRMLAAAAGRGELLPDVQEHAGELVARILGTLMFQRFMLGARLDQGMVADAVDLALAPWTPET